MLNRILIVQMHGIKLEAISKIGCWFNFEDFKRGTHPAGNGGRPEDIFEIAQRFHAQGSPGFLLGPGPASFHCLRGLTHPGGITNCGGK